MDGQVSNVSVEFRWLLINIVCVNIKGRKKECIEKGRGDRWSLSNLIQHCGMGYRNEGNDWSEG